MNHAHLPLWLPLLHLQMILMKLSSCVGCPISSWSCTSLLFCPKKAFNGVNTYWHIFAWLMHSGCQEWKGSHWKHVGVAFIVMRFICVVVSFVGPLCWHFGLYFVAAIVCTIVLKVGPSPLVALVCLLHSFTFSDTWCVWSDEFSSAIALHSFVPSANIINIPDTLFYHPQLYASVSPNAAF